MRILPVVKTLAATTIVMGGLSLGTIANAHSPESDRKDQIQVNAISINYFPLIAQPGTPQDNWRLDTKQTRQAMGLNPSEAAIDDYYGEYNFTLAEISNRASQIRSGAKNALEEGTRFQGYKYPGAKKIKYKFVGSTDILEPVPLLNDRFYNGNPLPDYLAMMNRQNICKYVDKQGVKEVWLFTYAGVGKAGWESNFSSKYGDISNSDRYPYDLPICQHSYTVYDYNYGRYIAEALEDHMHQFEAIFSAIDIGLFQTFTGFNGGVPTEQAQTTGIRRCGNSHFPPNGVKDYDWSNPNPVPSDCEDWHPVGIGEVKQISSSIWNSDPLYYFIYWMQNVPGFTKGLTDCAPNDQACVPTKRLKNWWTFIYDFDNAYKDITFWQPDSHYH